MTGARAAPGARRRACATACAAASPARSPSAASGAAARCWRWSLTLQELGVDDRDLYLFDTFEGMTAPDRARRLARSTRPALETWQRGRRSAASAPGPSSSTPEHLQRGRRARDAARPPATRPSALHFVARPGRGDAARRTRPSGSRCCGSTPTGTSRRATSSSTSTRASRDGGVLIIDDYGHWEGARRAVDEYFASARRRRCCSTGSTTRAGSPSSTERGGAADAPRAGRAPRASPSAIRPRRRARGARSRARAAAARSRGATACWLAGPLEVADGRVARAPRRPPRRRRPRPPR